MLKHHATIEKKNSERLDESNYYLTFNPYWKTVNDIQCKTIMLP